MDIVEILCGLCKDIFFLPVVLFLSVDDSLELMGHVALSVMQTY